MISRRDALRLALVVPAGVMVSACGDSATSDRSSSAGFPEGPERRMWMPAEEARHDATWMCFPGRADVWGSNLSAVQGTIAEIGLTIAEFEPVRLLVRPRDLAAARDLVGSALELIEAPVDDLWARDTLPLFLLTDGGDLAASRLRFNGWGGKQVHDGDALLAGIVADRLGIELIDSGLVGEGGGVETDGHGTLLAARSSWVNDNRNPGRSEADVGEKLTDALGAERILWVDGIAGQDITDGHIDTLARFVGADTIIHEFPSYVEPGEIWYDLAIDTTAALEGFSTLDGDPYELVRLEQPAVTRRRDPDFLASYVNYYVCNGGVIIPSFGDAKADGRAAEQIGDRYPGRETVLRNIDPVSAGGGGIHCATQQQPAP